MENNLIIRYYLIDINIILTKKSRESPTMTVNITLN